MDNLQRGKQYVKQAQGRSLELKGLLYTAKAGTADWDTILAVHRSLETNIDSAAADLGVEREP
ncbi:MAG: hypothetical protein ACREN5_07970 [Gemmatimonadales bacterium]